MSSSIPDSGAGIVLVLTGCQPANTQSKPQCIQAVTHIHKDHTALMIV